MRLQARVRQLEARGGAAPALVREWTEMLTRLRASLADYYTKYADDPEKEPLYQVSDAEIAAEARYYAERGIPATLTDWFRHLREVAASEGGEDAATHTP